ncbi:hypothetical protein GW931_01945 [archaeon]|nr:hypothetical protein [archaeon]
MLLELILFLFGGILFGTVTGLTPGIHINLIGGILISLPFLNLNPIYLVVFVTSMAITHTFLDFIPSVFLGCPDTDTELSILPGHELLKNKKGFEAVYLSNIGSLIAIFLLILILIPSILFMKNFYNLILSLIPYILIGVSLIVVFTEKNKINSLVVFLLTGFLGYSLLTLPLKEPLLPLLTGLFGASNIILSLKNKTKIPPQEITFPKIKLKKPILGALLSAPFCSFLPGVGSGQAAVIGNVIIKQNRKEFLVLLGIINTLVMGFSFVSLYLIGKTRTGATATIKQFMGNPSTNEMILIVIVIILSGFIAFKLTNFFGKKISKKIEKINYSKISYFTLILLGIVVFLVSGFWGLLVLVVSTLTGIYCISLNIKRTNMMGSLIIPTILFYLGIN